MRGLRVETLIRTAAWGFVAVLVVVESKCPALILESSNSAPVLVSLHGITHDVLRDLTITGPAPTKRSDAAFEPHLTDRFMAGVQNGMLQFHAPLAKVWHTVVKAVMVELGLQVSVG
jgi:hypothetical protein